MAKNYLLYSILFAFSRAQFQPPPDQQSQFGVNQQQQGATDPRQQQQFPGQQQQQQFPSGPGQQQQSGQFGSQQPIGGQAFGSQSVGGGNFGPGSLNQPQQPSIDQLGVQGNPNQPPTQFQGGSQQQQQGSGTPFGGPSGVQPQMPLPQPGQQQLPQNNLGGGPMPAVKITTDLLPVDLAQHADRLMWSEPRSDVVYCVSAAPTTNLQFFCFDCNTTYGQQFNDLLQKATVNFQQVAGYPAIKLNSIPIVGEELYMKTLSCVAYYGTSPSGGGSLNITAASSIILQFLSTPLVVDQQAHGPLYANPQDGYQFYVPQQGGFTLFCMARGNPAPAAYNWTVNGAPISGAGTAPQLRVDAQTYAGKAIACKAYSQAYPQGRESAAVGIMTWIPPMVTANNFQELQKQGSLFETGTTNVQIGKRATYQCAVTGLPVPWVWWRQELNPGNVVNASCDGGRQDSAPQLGQTGYAVTSQCAVDINSYDKTGRYWCTGCNYLSSGTYQCVPEERQVSASSVRIDVIGQPLIPQEEPPRYEQADQGSVKAGVPYCANPEPTLPDGVFWQINGQRLNVRNELENYVAEVPQQNGTVPNCWIAWLKIRHVSESDRAKTFRLTVTNQMGTTFREFQLHQLNATLLSSGEGGAVGLAVGLSLGLLFLILLILCAFCWWKRLLCFGSARRRPSTQQKQTKEKFQPNVASDIGKDRPTEKIPPGITRPPYDLPPSEPDRLRPPRPPPLFASSSSRISTAVHGNGTSSPSGRRKHEGLNYAELDLVKDSHRPTVGPTSVGPLSSQYRPQPGSEYSRFQQPASQTVGAQLKSPTNSTV